MNALNIYLMIGWILIGQALVKSPAEQVAFFPEAAFHAEKELNDSRVEWYSKHFLALKEPSLLQLSQDNSLHCYRFVWLRTFDEPVSIRLVINADGSGQLLVKVTSGRGGYEAGELVTDKSISISKADVGRVLNLLNRTRFWTLPTRERQEISEKGSVLVNLDGAQWIIEGVRMGRYHVVDRWSPKNGAYRDLAMTFLELSKLRVKEIY